MLTVSNESNRKVEFILGTKIQMRRFHGFQPLCTLIHSPCQSWSSQDLMDFPKFLSQQRNLLYVEGGFWKVAKCIPYIRLDHLKDTYKGTAMMFLIRFCVAVEIPD